ncbi:MAG: DUF3575 domain-containing protein [Culturomica sp.]|nr:DUF3575 domain-containing protein [Culturomica sp.]
MIFVSFLSGNLNAQDSVSSPDITIKTNLLYDATTTLNLGVEVPLSNKFSLDIPLNYNPWTFSEGRKIKHWLVQPELRYWLKETLHGSFFGLHAHGAQFNVAGKSRRYQGWLAGGGVSYGYQWSLGGKWRMEASVGVGYAYIDYEKWTQQNSESPDCAVCKKKTGTDVMHYVGPTKAAVSLIYTFGNRSRKRENTYYPASEKVIVRTDTIYVPILNNDVETLTESGKVFILFPWDESDMSAELIKNDSLEMCKMQRIVDSVSAIDGVQIKRIDIDAYSSPEGNLHHNINLAEKRGESLKNYIVRNCALSDSLFTIRSRGENWEGLADAIPLSYLTPEEQKDILKILDLQDVSTRKILLQQYKNGEVYNYLLKKIYPQLRVCVYKIEYTIPVKYEN